MINKYVITGITKLIYSMRVDSFLSRNSLEDPIVFTKNIYEIGIEYKKHTDLSWTKCEILKTKDQQHPMIPYTTVWALDNDTYEREEGLCRIVKKGSNYIAIADAIEKTSSIQAPIYILVEGLDANTSYDARAYYVDNSGTHTYNEVTISTNPNLNRPLQCGGIYTNTSILHPELTDDTTKEGYSLKARINSILAIPNSMVNRDISYNDNIYVYIRLDNRFYGATMAEQGDTITCNEDLGGITLIIHELCHGFMPREYTDIIYDPLYNPSLSTTEGQMRKRMKDYLSFCNGNDNAEWIWRNKHNFPIISGNPSGRIEGTYSNTRPSNPFSLFTGTMMPGDEMIIDDVYENITNYMSDAELVDYVYDHIIVAAWEVLYPQTQ